MCARTRAPRGPPSKTSETKKHEAQRSVDRWAFAPSLSSYGQLVEVTVMPVAAASLEFCVE
jgi:hypothetical protein